MAQQECLFCRIVAGEEPAETVAGTDQLVVFRDKYPRAPVHVLVVPREHIGSAHDLGDDHGPLLAACFGMARQVADQEGIADGYRIATNIGSRGGQAIGHLHFHVLGGKQLGHVDGATG
ncbi:MAG TPA: HIT domain-containing protein [Nitriliruptorales bacterium]|nr:HIT domain-containing protein [Nitriliruptorales bacterium]